MTTPPAGWYDDQATPGRQRWFDGTQWTDHFQNAPSMTPPPAYPAQQWQQPLHTMGPPSSNYNVVREVVYNRQQTPHSATVWTLISIFTGGFGLIWVVYYSLSPDHYWKA